MSKLVLRNEGVCFNPFVGTQHHSDDPLLPKDLVLTPHTDKLSLDADLPGTEEPPSPAYLSDSSPATQSPNLLSLSIGQGLGVGVHIMAANRQSLDSANIAVISTGQEYTH